MACDQPLFVLAKQIQWEWPEIYGEERFVVSSCNIGINYEMLMLTCGPIPFDE
jgi:hypothetical protein